MKQLLKKAVKATPLCKPLKHCVAKRKQKKELVEWERNGRPVPPPLIIKSRPLRKFAEKYSLKILVETGILYDDMIEAMKADFDKICSIELGNELFEKAKKRFELKKSS